MNNLIRYVLNKYAGEMEISQEKKLEMLLDILTEYLKLKNCL